MDEQSTDSIPRSRDIRGLSQSLPSNSSPTLIIIFGWMGARMSHLKKYAQAYETLYPSSTQMIVNADSWWYWKGQAARERSLYPSIRKLEDLGILQTPDGTRTPHRVLLHVLSNGGACSLVDMGSALSKYPSQTPLGAKSAIVFDSAPGGGTFLSANRSFTAAIRNPIAKVLAMCVVSVTYVVMLAFRILTRRPHPFKNMLVALNEPKLLPWISRSTPRLYIYSAGDKIVEENVVEEHATKARKEGIPVYLEHFGKSGHVAHLRDNPKRYWDAIQKLWIEALKV